MNGKRDLYIIPAGKTLNDIKEGFIYVKAKKSLSSLLVIIIFRQDEFGKHCISIRFLNSSTSISNFKLSKTLLATFLLLTITFGASHKYALIFDTNIFLPLLGLLWEF